MHDTLTPINALSSIWAEHEALTLQRVDLLEAAVEGLIAGNLSDTDRERARQAAHMLAGSVGMFGFEHSSRAAHALEEALQEGVKPDRPRAQTLRKHVTAMRTEGLEPSRA